MSDNRPPTNFRATRRKQERNLLLLVLAVLVIGGTVIIGLIWGIPNAIPGGICLLGGGGLIGGLWLLLTLLQRWVED